MKKSPFLALKTNNATSQSVPNKKPSTCTLNYLQILKQYNSCNKLLKNDASSLQPANRNKLSKDPSSFIPPPQTAQTVQLKPKFTTILNTNCSKTLLKPANPLLTTPTEEKMGSPSQYPSSKLPNKYAMKVPFDTYLRSSKNKENTEAKPFPPLIEKSDKENPYFIGDKAPKKKSSKAPSNGSERESFHKENFEGSPREKIIEPEKKEANNENFTCFYHPDKKAKYMKTKDENMEISGDIQYYCSKCAIDLAVKGIRIYDIDENRGLLDGLPKCHTKRESLHSFQASPNEGSPKVEEKSDFEQMLRTPTRRDEIDEFLIKLEAVKKNGNNSFLQLERRRQDISNFYNQQITKTEEFFKRMEIVLQTNKRILTDKLHKFKEDAELNFKNHIKQSEQTLSELQKIEFDIKENVENIVKNMEELPFKTIITKYDSKISQFQKSFTELYKEPLILNKILISFKNYKEQENNFSKFNEEVWNLVRPYFSFNRIPVTFLEEDNDLDFFVASRNDIKREIFVSFENKDLFEENQRVMMEDENKADKANLKNDNLKGIPTETISSPTAKKYLDLLNKISNNQENNNIFFSNLMMKNEQNENKNQENQCQEFIKFKQKQENSSQASNSQKNLFFSPNFRENLELS